MNRFLRISSVVIWSVAVLFAQSSSQPKPLTIESIFAEGGISGRGPENIKWSPDNSLVSFIQRDDTGERGQLWVVDSATGEKKLLVSEVKLNALAPSVEKIKNEREKERVTRYHVDQYLWSPDSKHLLFDSQGQLWLFTIENGTSVQVTSSPEPSGDPKFSPDGQFLAYVRQHNLFVRPVWGAEEKQLGKEKEEKNPEDKKELLNGEVDWVYAEELSVRSNYFWSPDGKNLVFLQMDETQVPTYPIPDWMGIHANADMQRYPQPGDLNPAVRLGVVSASGGKVRWLSLTDNPDIYIPRFGWVREGVIWAEVMTRVQDRLDLYFIDARSGHSRQVLTESQSGAWVNVNDDFKILKSGDRFLWSSWRDGHTHLYLYSFNKENPLGGDAKLERQLTSGDFEVLQVDGIDETDGLVFFTCNRNDPRQKQLYSVKLDGSDLKQVSQEPGTHAGTFAEDGKHWVDEYSATVMPPRLSLCSLSALCRTIWDSRAVNDYGLIEPKFLEFKADDGTTLYGTLLLPPGSANGNKFPVIDYVYGGPAAQTVKNEWDGTRGLFHQLLARSGFAIFSVDNRGTPARDRKFQTAIKGEFGAIELKDQVAALDQLIKQFPQLDRSRIGIWGWSNGGSMTLYAMTHSDMFKAGVSVAPVTDWRLYDSIYTERYLNLPKDNASGYLDSSMPRAADKLHGALLLVHGTSDDNVHFQNSVQMSEALIRAGKQFRFMIYPNKTHGIGGATDRDHLFHMIQDHFERELKP